MTQPSGISPKAARHAQTQQADSTPVAAPSVPPDASSLQSVQDGYVGVAAKVQASEPVPSVKLAVVLTDPQSNRRKQRSIATELQALQGTRILEGDGPITLGPQRPLIIEVQPGSLDAVSKHIENLESVSVLSLADLVTEHTGRGSADPQEILQGLQNPHCSVRIETARSLANRLRKEGRRFTGSDELRNQMGDAVFHLASDLAGIFNRLESDSQDSIIDVLEAAAEDEAEPSLDWADLNRIAGKQLKDSTRFPELSAVREVLKDMCEALSRLNTPRSLAMLDQVLVAAHSAGASRIKGIKGASERLFTATLDAAQNRINRSEVTASSADVEELHFDFRALQNLRTGAHTRLLKDSTWDPNTPFSESSHAPFLLLTGPKGHQLKEQWVAFVLNNESRVEIQAATVQERAVKKAVDEVLGQQQRMKAAFHQRNPDLNWDNVVDDDFEEQLANAQAKASKAHACAGHSSLESVVKGLRVASFLTRSPAEKSRYTAAVLPIYVELLDKVQSPRLLALVVDEAISMLHSVRSEEGAHVQDLETKLRPFVDAQRIRDAMLEHFYSDMSDEEKVKASVQYQLQMFQTYDRGLAELGSDSLKSLLRQETLNFVAAITRTEGPFAVDEAVQSAMDALKNKASVETDL